MSTTRQAGIDIVADLRSDTVTKPTRGMRTAMARADVGDDVYREDPTVRDLEERVAGMLGHEAGLFLPSGTMGNQVAVQALVPRGGEVLCAADAHFVTYEAGAAAAHGGISTRTWTTDDGLIDVDTVAGMIHPGGSFANRTFAVVVEQTANLPGGLVHPLQRLIALRELADSTGVALHCDGARLWHAHIATGMPLHVYGGLFDTLSVCLSKGLGAPVGSVMVGSTRLVDEARRLRQRAGGAMRQAGVIAAAGLHALKHHLGRLGEDHRRAHDLAAALASTGVVQPDRVHSNMVVLDLEGTGWTAAGLVAAAAEQGVLSVAIAPRRVRLVTHLDVTEQHLRHAIHVLTGLLGRGTTEADRSQRRPSQPMP
ncbi:low-specificity L-threonine aldolase [Dactylosporangium maewongense]|uniref:Low-specificity L-threonine aldolase n=1 Tax=Dactylosporangium maewongense TaxID=634393 RepID=A0ABN2CWK9_9ACTN